MIGPERKSRRVGGGLIGWRREKRPAPLDLQEEDEQEEVEGEGDEVKVEEGSGGAGRGRGSRGRRGGLRSCRGLHGGVAAKRRRKTSFEAVFGGSSVRSLLLGNQHGAVEGSDYFCHPSFQDPDWQLFLEPESHCLLHPPETGVWGGRGDALRTISHFHAHMQFTHANTQRHTHMRPTCVHSKLWLISESSWRSCY